ncbi:phosphate-binding protein PstS precursor [bacterium BMS3Abin02]|nr:phosphate-binding protein PstS precursor [bacterium BMS3Abin02]GBE20812.1 phosphate-binding protein PstS precursor [bacterium BMS3Bbin01]
MSDDQPRRKRSRTIRIGVLVAAVTLVAAACSSSPGSAATPAPAGDGTTTATSAPVGDGTTSAPPTLSGTLNGAGATFPAPIYLEWIGAYQKQFPDVRVNYQAIGSGGGVQNFIQQTVDFAGTDAYLTDDELAQASQNGTVYHIPTVFGAVVPAYNLPGVDGLTLDCDSLAGVFLGTITRWNDPAIADLNPQTTLPDQDIQIVHRSDGSGTTNAFTLYLDTCNPQWHDTVGYGKDVEWPVGVGGKGNDGVAAAISNTEGSLGYVELAYATQTGLQITSMVNKSGNVIEASLESTAAAADGVTFPDDLRFTLADTGAPQGWPIATATWILAYGNMAEDKAQLLRSWLTWALTEGDDAAMALDYAPIPDSLQERALAFVNQIGAG